MMMGRTYELVQGPRGVFVRVFALPCQAIQSQNRGSIPYATALCCGLSAESAFAAYSRDLARCRPVGLRL
jgi:hypothetical protein